MHCHLFKMQNQTQREETAFVMQLLAAGTGKVRDIGHSPGKRGDFEQSDREVGAQIRGSNSEPPPM